MTSLSELKFFSTPPHDCSYLEDRQAVTVFADPAAEIDTRLYSTLSSVGFRRSGGHIYRPHCGACRACISARVPVANFKMNRKQTRAWRRNADLTVTHKPPSLTEEYFDLYERYIATRHADGDMYPAEVDQFRSFLVEGRSEASFYDIRLGDTLLGVAVADELIDGLSAIYTFFDPDQSRRSLGVFGILWLIRHARELGLPYLYLGYWIKDCEKMSYKMEYQPLELFIGNRWIMPT